MFLVLYVEGRSRGKPRRINREGTPAGKQDSRCIELSDWIQFDPKESQFRITHLEEVDVVGGEGGEI